MNNCVMVVVSEEQIYVLCPHPTVCLPDDDARAFKYQTDRKTVNVFSLLLKLCGELLKKAQTFVAAMERGEKEKAEKAYANVSWHGACVCYCIVLNGSVVVCGHGMVGISSALPPAKARKKQHSLFMLCSLSLKAWRIFSLFSLVQKAAVYISCMRARRPLPLYEQKHLSRLSAAWRAHRWSSVWRGVAGVAAGVNVMCSSPLFTNWRGDARSCNGLSLSLAALCSVAEKQKEQCNVFAKISLDIHISAQPLELVEGRIGFEGKMVSWCAPL